MLANGWDEPVRTLDGATIGTALQGGTLNLSESIMVVGQTQEEATVEGGKVGKAATASGKARTKRKGKKGRTRKRSTSLRKK